MLAKPYQQMLDDSKDDYEMISRGGNNEIYTTETISHGGNTLRGEIEKGVSGG